MGVALRRMQEYTSIPPCSAGTASSPWDVGAQGREDPREASEGADRDRYRGRPLSHCLLAAPDSGEQIFLLLGGRPDV